MKSKIIMIVNEKTLNKKNKLFEIKDGKLIPKRKYKRIKIIDTTSNLIDFSDLDFSTMEFLTQNEQIDDE